jgi:hypothetical protein
MVFEAYRKLGPGRSQKTVCLMLHLPLSSTAIIAKRNSWLARAESWDAEVKRLALAGLEDSQVEMRDRHANLSAKLLEKAETAITMADPRFIHPRDIPIWIDVAAKLERLSRGVTDTKRVELTGKDGGPITVAQELTPGQRRELLAAAHAELGKRVQQTALEEGILEGEIVEDDD